MGSESPEENTEREAVPALKAIGDETRLGIVQALVEHRRENPQDPGLSFSGLREATGIRDSGRFNYHLDKLRSRFVEEADGEYELTYPGQKLAIALVSGEYHSGITKDPVELDNCPVDGCTAPLLARYSEGYVRVACDDDHPVFQTSFPPVAAVERSVAELLDIVVRRVYDDIGMVQEEVCPFCYGPLRFGVEETDDGTYMYEGGCERCGTYSTAPPGLCVVPDPEVRGFYNEHGTDIYDIYPWELAGTFGSQDRTKLSDDPFRLQVTTTLSGDKLHATLDESGTVVETARGE